MGRERTPTTDVAGASAASTGPTPDDPVLVTEQAAAGQGAPSPAVVVDGASAGTPAIDAAAAAILAAAGEPIAGTRPVALPLGGPGAGAARLSERVEGPQFRDIGLDDRPEQRIPRAGGVDPRYDPRTGLPSAGGGRRVLGMVDAARVPGRRFATAARLIEHDNAIVEPGRFIPLSFREFTDLVTIGAVVADPWDALEDVPGSEI